MSLSAILNSPLLYALVGGGILIVLVIATIFFLRGRKRALELGVSKEVPPVRRGLSPVRADGGRPGGHWSRI